MEKVWLDYDGLGLIFNSCGEGCGGHKMSHIIVGMDKL